MWVQVPRLLQLLMTTGAISPTADRPFFMGSKVKASAKHGRNRKSGQNLVYKSEQRREKSHVTRIRRHILRFGVTDGRACEALMNYAEKLGLNALQSAREFVRERQKALR